MKEPFQSQFRELVRTGASSQDIHDLPVPIGFALPRMADEPYVDREIGRVESHQKSLLPILERFVGKVSSVLDAGCNTGGSAIAIARSSVLRPAIVIGVDPNLSALQAARVRAQGYDMPVDRIRFEGVDSRGSLPFSTGEFDLTTCVSVLEFVSTHATRHALAADIQRVTRPGGFVFVATPSPYSLGDVSSCLGSTVSR